MRAKVAKLLRLHCRVQRQNYRRVKREWGKLPRSRRYAARLEILGRLVEGMGR